MYPAQNKSDNVRDVSPKREAQDAPQDQSGSPKKKQKAMTKQKEMTDGIVMGSSSFMEIARSTAFIDKTMIIKDIIASKDKVLLITCPRRFFKSVNMHMLKLFFASSEDDNEMDKILAQFQTLKIANSGNVMNTHCQKYPVIFVNFLNATGKTYDEIEEGVKHIISATYTKHSYLLDELKKMSTQAVHSSRQVLIARHCATVKKFINCNVAEISTTDLVFSLKYLSEILYFCTNKKVYVLMDEYDAPLNHALFSKNNEVLRAVSKLMHDILQAVLKDNDAYLNQGILTGVSAMVRAVILSGLNNVVEKRFLYNHEFNLYYGFTQEDMKEIYMKFGYTQKIQNQIARWYDGYSMVQQEEGHAYSPWSVLACLKHDTSCFAYWETSTSIAFLSTLFHDNRLRDTFKKLISKNNIAFKRVTSLDLNDLMKLQQLFDSSEGNNTIALTEDAIDLLLSYMCELGYLSLSNIVSSDPKTPSSDSNSPGNSVWRCKIPNQEMLDTFYALMIDYYIKTFNISHEQINNVTNSIPELLLGQVSCFKESLEILFKSIKYTSGNNQQDGYEPNEDLFHSLINMTIMKARIEHFATEKRVKYGSTKSCGIADIVFSKGSVGVVIEVKYKHSVQNALDQITQKEYDKVYDNNPEIRSVLCIGININEKKEVEVGIESSCLNSTAVIVSQEDDVTAALSCNVGNSSNTPELDDNVASITVHEETSLSGESSTY